MTAGAAYVIIAVDQLEGEFEVARLARPEPGAKTRRVKLITADPAIRDQLTVGATVLIQVIAGEAEK